MRAKPFVISLLCIAIFTGVASASPGISMNVGGMDEGVLPGELAIYNVEVKSITDQAEHAVFNIENPLPGWGYEFNPQEFDINPDETKYAYFNVTVPENATPRTYTHKINLVAQAITVPAGGEETSYTLLLVVKSTTTPSPSPSPTPSPSPLSSPTPTPTPFITSTQTISPSPSPTPIPSQPLPSPTPAPTSTLTTPLTPTPTPTQIPSPGSSPVSPIIPGFEVALTIAGFLITGYFMQRRKKNLH